MYSQQLAIPGKYSNPQQIHPSLAISNSLSIQANEPYVLSLTPRQETKSLDFIDQNLDADGRGVVIAIFDTGVDPGAPGLNQTSDGKVKVIERYDCSGAGDVDTSTIVSAISGENGAMILKGLTGRNIIIPPTWNNKSGKFHIGFKPVFELYPPDLLERMQLERHGKHWFQQQKCCLGIAEQGLENCEDVSNSVGLDAKFQKEEMAARFELLSTLDAEHEDLGPVLDCIIFQDNNDIWQICLSLEPDQGILLREYNHAHEYSPILPTDRFNISVNVWNDGNLLEIVGMNDPHGTHVAAIAAAYFPLCPQLNGVAPGAQIVSLTIGDTRIDSQETSNSVARAMTRVMRCPKIHVINMSYGEQSAWAPHGRIAKMMLEVIDKHGVVWVSAAGNDGPCISTVDSPCWICDDCIIGVAAYVSPQMMPSLYSHYDANQDSKHGMPYTWSARGPAPDGGMCINVCAPGGAITSVPNYTLMAATLMNGTSMASPHCAGCVALLISKALQQNLPYTPYTIKRSLENTAIDVEHIDPFGQGAGLIQIPEAYEMMQYVSTIVDKFVRFNIECSGGLPGLPMRGIYIRSPPLKSAKEFKVTATPVFFKNETISTNIKIMYKQHLSLICNSHWVKAPSFLEVHNCKNTFTVLVSPANLSPGIHYARIDAVDDGDLFKGPLFSVDVTLIIPIPVVYGPMGLNPRVNFGELNYTPGELKRFFIRPPISANWAELKIKAIFIGLSTCRNTQTVISSSQTTSIIQTLTITPGQIESRDCWKNFKLHLHEEKTVKFSVFGNKIIEIMIGRWWEESENVRLIATIRFKGITIDKPLIGVPMSDVVAQVHLSSYLNAEEINPSASLTHLVQLLHATDMSIVPLTGLREETSPGKPIYELQATYQFSILHKTNVTFDCPLLCQHLYESEYQSQLWMLFDHNKQYLTGGDAFPKRFNQIVYEGNYYIRMHIRHTDIRELHRFMGPKSHARCRPITDSVDKSKIPLLPVHLRMTLHDSIPLKIFTTFGDAIASGKRTCKSDKFAQFIIGESISKESKKPISSPVFPLKLRKNEFMDCFMKVLLTDEDLKDLPTHSGFCLEGHFNISDATKYVCHSDIKIFIPPKIIEEKEKENLEDGGEEPRKKNITPDDIYKFCVDISKLTESQDMDVTISHLLDKKYYGLAVKILLHKFELHPSTLNQDWNKKLRDCYEQLGWTHCIFYLDTNWLVRNPPDFRTF